MQVFTSSLPDQLFTALSEKAAELKVPKNKIIEKALALYLEQLSKAAYIKSYRQMSQDTDILQLAEEGMQVYFAQLNGLDQDEARWNMDGQLRSYPRERTSRLSAHISFQRRFIQYPYTTYYWVTTLYQNQKL